MEGTEQDRAAVLKRFGASSAISDEILAYDALRFNRDSLANIKTFPLPDERFVAEWQEYALELESASGFEVLADRLVQLSFPIQKDVSRTADYIAVTRKGCVAGRVLSATGINLEHSRSIKILIHPTWAGRIPIIIAPCRQDFVSILRAFVAHNEPVPVPDSMGACIISGYNNWHRFRKFNPHAEPSQKLDTHAYIVEKEHYQDRFVLLSCGYYSGVPPCRIGLSDESWRDLSLIIRREHECAHYWTRRVLGSMRNYIVDEIIADYCGVLAATGCFRPDWLLMFLGLDLFPQLRGDARLHNYRGLPPLSDEGFKVIQTLVISAMANLDRFHLTHREQLEADTKTGQLLLLLSLSWFTLEELACESAVLRLTQRMQQERAAVSGYIEQTESAN